MAEVALEPEEDIEEYARQKALEIRRPIPGQSLTNDPEQPWPWEGQPKFSDMNDALEYFFDKFTEEELFEDLMDLLEDGVPVMSLVEIFLQQGFQEGLFNPDLMLLLAEPLAYMLIALAERQMIDVVIMDEEGEPRTDQLGSALQTIEEPQRGEEFPEEIDNQIQSSLLARE